MNNAIKEKCLRRIVILHFSFSQDRNWIEINDIQWDYNYSISVQAVSTKGRSKPVTLIVTNGMLQQPVCKVRFVWLIWTATSNIYQIATRL